MIYLRLYTKDSDYQNVVSNDQLLLPNVSHTIDADEVYYNPVQGSNEIWYTSVSGGKVYVNPDSFSGTTGELLTVQSHFYADGVGRIIFNDDVASIDENAFYNPGAPQSLEDENTPVVAKVATYSSPRGDYDELLSVTFPDGVKELKDYSLSNSYLKEISIPKTVTSISKNAISIYAHLNKINVASGNTTYSSEGNCLVNLSDGVLLKGTSTSIIPDNVKSINGYAFYNCSGLTNINIPNNVILIGYSAFYNCTSLRNINIPDNVIFIGYSAFCNCSGLTSVELGSGVTSINSSAFYGCTSLTNIKMLSIVPPTLGSSAFSYISSSAKIYVPSESVDTYKAADGWSSYAGIIQAIPSE